MHPSTASDLAESRRCFETISGSGFQILIRSKIFHQEAITILRALKLSKFIFQNYYPLRTYRNIVKLIFTLLTHDHVLSYFVSGVCVHHTSHNY